MMHAGGSKKVLSHCPRQIDFPSGQVAFHANLPELHCACPKGKLELSFFSSPDASAYVPLVAQENHSHLLSNRKSMFIQ